MGFGYRPPKTKKQALKAPGSISVRFADAALAIGLKSWSGVANPKQAQRSMPFPYGLLSRRWAGGGS